jgi:hypothetical protein
VQSGDKMLALETQREQDGEPREGDSPNHDSLDCCVPASVLEQQRYEVTQLPDFEPDWSCASPYKVGTHTFALLFCGIGHTHRCRACESFVHRAVHAPLPYGPENVALSNQNVVP